MDECIVVLNLEQAYQLSNALRNAADSGQFDGTESPIVEVTFNSVTGEIITTTPFGSFLAETHCIDADIN